MRGPPQQAARKREQLLFATGQGAARPVEIRFQAWEQIEYFRNGLGLAADRKKTADAQVSITLNAGKISRPCGT